MSNMIDRDVIVRSTNAGVFIGTLYQFDPQTCYCTIRNSRRVWRWAGAASLSELATKGPAMPNECKFPAPVDEQVVGEVIEIIPLTIEARQLIDKVPVWTAHEVPAITPTSVPRRRTGP